MKIDGYEGEYLSEDEILLLHDKIIDASEAKDDKGFIDVEGALFRSSVNSIFAGFDGWQAYPSIEEKACRLCFNIVSSHCFRNANKRTGLMSMILTYEMNNMKINLSEEELFEAVTTIGEHADENIWENFKSQIINNVAKTK